MTFENLPSSPLPESTVTYVEQLRKMKPSSASNIATNRIVLFSAAWCGYCKQAKAYLAEKRILTPIRPNECTAVMPNLSLKPEAPRRALPRRP
jgi:hypothetical protein